VSAQYIDERGKLACRGRLYGALPMRQEVMRMRETAGAERFVLRFSIKRLALPDEERWKRGK